MVSPIRTGAVNHVRLTVTDINRSWAFYTELLNFEVVSELSPTIVLVGNGSTLLVLAHAPERPIAGDRFDPNRVGLDHLSFQVAHRDDLEQAAGVLDERGITRGEIGHYPDLGISVLPFDDPDGIQLELTAPYTA